MTGQCRVEQRGFRGWNGAWLENGLVTLVAVPDIGGRIMAYDLGPYQYLYVDRELAGKLFTPDENQGDGSLAAWKNYGGDKTWPAPQGWDRADQWHGPPDPVLDTGRYCLEALESDGQSAVVRMTSPATSPTGVQITRQATLGAGTTRVVLDLSFHNISQRSIQWSIWDVVQLDAGRLVENGRLAYEPGCIVTAPLNRRSKFAEGYCVMFGCEDNPQWRADPGTSLFYGEYRWEIGKVGLDSRGGWAAFANTATGQAFAACFTSQPGAEYPDDGADVEFWTVGRGRVANLDYEQTSIFLMECEILTPLQQIEPGQSATTRIEWGACRCPGPVVDVHPAGCTGRRLQVRRLGDYVHLAGAFGVFDQGDLLLHWQDGSGQTLQTAALGKADPLAAVLLDHVLLAPPEVKTAQLAVEAGGQVRRLAQGVVE